MPDAALVVGDPERLAALRRVLLLDSPPTPQFDRLTRLAARLLDAPVALLTLIDADRQYLKSAFGLPEPLAAERETPLRYSICQHALAVGGPLVVRDTSAHAELNGHPAASELGVRAYAGVPVTSPDGYGLGALCVLDWQPREWGDDEVGVLSDLAAIANDEVALHLHERRVAHWRRRILDP
ncbi:MAG: GAF domain-containing protein [Acidimicrobiales bacterium]